MAANLKKGETPDWLRLQRKIFTRWVNQKVRGKCPPCEDVVKSLSDGILLIDLMSALSDKPYTGKQEKNPKVKAQKIDNISNALNFTWSCGVQMKLKPSAEDLFDENDKMVLGLLWAIMLKYMKIGDEDDGQQLNAKDALLLWVQNKTAGYRDVKIENFTTSFHDGMALAALIHKHRPKLINYDSLNKDNRKANLELVMDAALKFFNLEKYLTPEDIWKLDENSMVVYISEYYYGIYEQRKLDLEAKKIGKVIKLTKENDAMKAKYNSEAIKLKERMDKAEKLLADRTIDNTMAGAKRRIEDFYAYKSNDKNFIIGEQLNLEALYNNLAVRLSHNKRPEYVPPSGVTLKDISVSAVQHLEECEQERKVALHAELNRQIRLVNLDGQHQTRFSKLKNWVKAKEEYLKLREEVDSISGAQLQLRLLDAYDKESSVHETSVQGQLKQIGAELIREKFEHSDVVMQREETIKSDFHNLSELSKAKRPVLNDHLSRELFKHKVHLMNQAHIDSYKQLHSWIGEKQNYLNNKEVINSVSEAKTQLSLLDSYEKDKKGLHESSVIQLNQLGAEIISQHYKTQYSEWKFEQPNEIKDRESYIEKQWEVLSDLSSQKKKILDDHLARELFKDKVRMMNKNHLDKYSKLQSWISEKEAYLNIKEKINSTGEAKSQLSLLEAYEKEKVTVTNGQVSQLKKIGSDILSAKYETSYSSYVFESPKDITERESFVDQKWKSLSELSIEKKSVLDDHLAREEFKEKVLLMNQNHKNKFHSLQAWIAEKETYLKTKEVIDSVIEARLQLSLLDAYEGDKDSVTKTDVTELKGLGKQTISSKYETKYSSYTFENPSEIKNREDQIDEKWNTLSELSAEKKRVLEDHLAREEFKESVRLMNSNHEDKFNSLQSWISGKESYLQTKESINSVAEAEAQLSLLDSYEKEKSRTSSGKVAQLKNLGSEILAKKYKTSYSEWVFETPQDIKKRESTVDEKFQTLSVMSSNKKKILEDDLAREIEKERLRLEYAHLASEFTRWIKDIAENLAVTQFGFVIEEVEAYQATLDKSNADIEAEAAAKKSEYEAVDRKMKEMNVKENQYTTLSLDDLAKTKATELNGAISTRNEAYSKELARQRANDALCKEFAKISEEFSKWINNQKDRITSSTEPIEKQLEHVKSSIESVDNDCNPKIHSINQYHEKMEAAEITNNRHTTLTAKDVEVQVQQYKEFLNRKKTMLEDEIANQLLRGITPEQFKEISETFQQFDKDKNGYLDKKELKTCLYSLGEEKSNSEVDAIIQKYASPGTTHVKYEGFKEFMISVLGVSDSKDDILRAFNVINRGDEFGIYDRMELVMNEDDLKYFTETAPKVEKGYEYKKWTDTIFSR